MNAYVNKKQISLEEKRKKLKKKKTAYQNSLNKKRETLNQNLKNFETEQLNKLKTQILKEHPNSPDDLKEYLMQEAFSMIGMKERTLLKEIEQRWNALERGLTKIGIKPDEFISKMEQNAE